MAGLLFLGGSAFLWVGLLVWVFDLRIVLKSFGERGISLKKGVDVLT